MAKKRLGGGVNWAHRALMLLLLIPCLRLECQQQPREELQFLPHY